MSPLFEIYAKENGRSPENQLAHDIGEFEQPMAGFHAWRDKKLDEFAALKGWRLNADGGYTVTHADYEEYRTWALSGSTQVQA